MPVQEDGLDDEVLRDLESYDVFDERRIPLEQRIEQVKQQINQWDLVAYNQKIAFQTNRAIGVPASELQAYVVRFRQAQKAVQDLEQRLVTLEQERPSLSSPAAQRSIRAA